MTRLLIALLMLCLSMPLSTVAQTPATPTTDPLERIKDEGLNHSQIMKTLTYLSDVIGPRLTNSPNFKRAAVWTRDQLTGWGLSNVHLEPWGPFGRGWELKSFSAQVVAPQAFPLIAFPRGWSPPTNGELVADVVYLDATNETELATFKGKLRGKIVLVGPMRTVAAHFEPLARRWNDFDLLQFSNDVPYPPNNDNFQPPPTATQLESARFAASRLKFVHDEGAAALLFPSPEGDGGAVYVMGVEIPRAQGAPRIRPFAKEAKTIPQVVVSIEQYNRMARMLQVREAVKVALNLAVQFYDDDLMSTHTIAEIPGGDLKDEMVMVGAHLDSWHAGTGATDDGAGVAVMMEAARILQTLNLKPRRTIRLALWGGEEVAGGSRYYVSQHFGEMKRDAYGKLNLVKAADYDKLAGYLNIDAGTGKLRGVFLANNEALRPIFRPWLEPFRSMGLTTLTSNGDWGSDFVFFDAIGLPIVSFIQDEIELETRTHHSNQDVLDRVQPEDLKQAAVIIAAFAYQIAMRNEKLPHRN